MEPQGDGDVSYSRKTQGILALSALLVLAGVAVWLLIAPAFRPLAPTHEQWLEAAAVVKAEFQPGDVIRLEPFWLTGGRIYFGDLDGGAREPFRILDVHRTLDVPWLMAHKRVWIVSSVEAREQQWAGQFPSAELLGEWSFDRISVVLLGMPDQAIAFDMVQHLESVKVQRQKGEKFTPCRRTPGGNVFSCGEGGKADVKVETREVAGGPRQCLLIRPMEGKAETRLHLALPPEPGRFFLRFGNTVEAGRQKDGSSVFVTIQQDSQPVAEAELVRKDYAIHEAVVEVTENKTSNVVVSLWAPDERKREVCFDGLFVRSPWCDGDAEPLCRQRP